MEADMRHHEECTQQATSCRGSAEEPAHHAYVTAVVAEITSQGMDVMSVHVSAAAAVRHADVELTAPDLVGCVLLRWDELNGWSWQTRNHGEEPAPMFFGVSLLPAPADLANWMVMSLRYSVVTSYRDCVPFVIPDLDTRLRAYHNRKAG
jgi:hypothetical protein